MKFTLKKPLPARPKSNNKKPRTTRYRTLQWPGHPLAQADGKVYAHRANLYEKIGPGDHTCHWCGRAISWHTRPGIAKLHSDHLDDDGWNNDPSNLVPACWSCNFQRAARPDFLTHCEAGHPRTEANTYLRPDGKGRQCRECNKVREKTRVRHQGAIL